MTVFVKPLGFTASTASPAPLTNTSVGNLAIDHPAMVWRMGLTGTYLIVDLGALAVTYDYIALVGSNLRSTDTVTIQTGNTNTGTGVYSGATTAAYTGFKPDLSRTISVFKLTSLRGERYVRIDISAPAHPTGYVEFSRLVIGKGTATSNVSFDAELNFEDQSVITTGPGFVDIDDYPVFNSWKVSIQFVSDNIFLQEFTNLYKYAGASKGILMVVDETQPALWQTHAIFGRIVSKAGGKAAAYNLWTTDLTVTAFAA